MGLTLSKIIKRIGIAALLLLSSIDAEAQSVRIKDLANVRGNRSNQLIGFGLVVGLAGTGDSAASLVKNRAMANMMTRLGMNAGPEDATSASVASVLVTADIAAFMRNGDKLTVKVSTVGDAKSLAGGTLIMTPLKAGDGQVYAVAQGAVVVGQANGAGPAVLTVATAVDGAVVEREFMPSIAPRGKLILSLRQADYTTSMRVADSINGFFKGFYATAVDPISVEVEVPPLYRGKLTEFVAEMESIRVNVDHKAVVVINERTGTVVMGADVIVGDVSIAHGSLSIRVGGSKGKKENVKNEALVNVKGTTVGELVESLNALGVKPGDLVGILQAIHTAGALRAEIKFM